jgi:hypothetical protein
MRWGRVWEYASDIAFFGGSQGQTTVALLGSSESIIGAPAQAESNHAPFYYTMRFFNQILEKGRVKIGDEWEDSGESQGDEPPPCYSYSDSVKIAYEALNGSEAKLEYLAFVLHKQRQLIVATPLYVAMVHE